MFSWELDFVILLWLSRYLFCCSYSHNVAPKGKFIAFVSTEAETDHPETELKAGIDLLGPVDEIFFDIYDRYEPVNEPTLENCFISTVSWSPQFYTVAFTNWCKLEQVWSSCLQSYDATTHFESTVLDVLNMYTMITGKVVNFFLSCQATGSSPFISHPAMSKLFQGHAQ